MAQFALKALFNQKLLLAIDVIDNRTLASTFDRISGTIFDGFVYNRFPNPIVLSKEGVHMGDARVVVTGASRGIGFEIAKACLAEGYNVLAVAKDEARLTQAALKLEGLLTFKADLTVDTEMEALIRHIADRWGRLDVLINNAGVMPQADRHIVTCSEEDFEYTMSVNFTAPYHLTKALIPYLQRSNSPRVINISSSMGVIGASLKGVYGLSKAMLNSLTVALSNELAGSVAVNAVAPGWVKTDMAPDGPGDPTDSARTVLRVMNLDNSISGGFFGGAGSLEFAKV